MDCPKCDSKLQEGFLYVRGIGASLFWSQSSGTKFFSKKGLQQVDLGQLSKAPVGAQAVIPGFRCNDCGLVAFDAE